MDAVLWFINDFFPFHMFFAIQLLLAELMFVFTQKKRSHSVLRITLSVLAYLLLSWFFPLPGFWFIRVLCIFFMSILLMFFCLDNTFTSCVFISITAYAIQNLAFNAGDILTNITGVPDKSLQFYAVSGAAFVVVYVVCWLLAVRRTQRDGKIHIGNLKLFVLSTATLIVVISKNILSSFGVLSHYDLAVLFTAVSCVLIIAVQQGAMDRGQIKEQNRIIEQLLKQDQNRMTALQENMNIINMKCHDMRHHINEYRKNADAGDHDKFFAEMLNSVTIYENTANTGNSALDVVLSDKLLFCGANNIKLSYLVDSAVLDKMEMSDIYSLFGNALENAINSVRGAEADRRIISLSVKRKGELGQIIISNYCKDPPTMVDGLPVSSGDAAYHGFGVKSMKYIVEKYGGNIIFGYSDEMFTLSILLPCIEIAVPHGQSLQISQI